MFGKSPGELTKYFYAEITLLTGLLLSVKKCPFKDLLKNNCANI
jgi:hypothetical protein